MIIAYKVFSVNRGKLFPAFHIAGDIFEHYDPRFIITRTKDCGPFACFNHLSQAEYFVAGFSRNTRKIYTVAIKESNDTDLWIGNQKWGWGLPYGTILADEFEILEHVK